MVMITTIHCAGAETVQGRQPGRQHHVGFRERRRHVQGGDHRRGLRDAREVRLRGPGGREARVLVPDGHTVRQEQGRGAAADGDGSLVRGAGGAGQRQVVRVHRLHEEPVRDGQRADGRLEWHGQEQGEEAAGGGAKQAGRGEYAPVVAATATIR